MAHRHTGYGVRPQHYKLVGEALIWTLKQGREKAPAFKKWFDR